MDVPIVSLTISFPFGLLTQIDFNNMNHRIINAENINIEDSKGIKTDQ
jgi:hypothetical protein